MILTDRMTHLSCIYMHQFHEKIRWDFTNLNKMDYEQFVWSTNQITWSFASPNRSTVNDITRDKIDEKRIFFFCASPYQCQENVRNHCDPIDSKRDPKHEDHYKRSEYEREYRCSIHWQIVHSKNFTRKLLPSIHLNNPWMKPVRSSHSSDVFSFER